jgi:hypothetical protein
VRPRQVKVRGTVPVCTLGSRRRAASCCLVESTALWSAAVGAVEKRRSVAARLIPWAATALIFWLIFSRVPFARVWEALAGARVLPYLTIMAPYSVFFLLVDTFCVTRVLNWFNRPIAYADVLPIRATTYLLTLVNSNLGQGGIALYLNRREGVPFLEVASSVVFLMFVELYQLVFFSSVGITFATRTIDLPLGSVYAALYAYLALHLLLFRLAGDRLADVRAARLLRSFRLARSRHYVLLVLYKAPNFLMATVVYYFALQCFGIHLPYLDLLLYLPIIFFSAALPIGVAHLGAPQFFWLYFFGGLAPAANVLAFSLATHFIFMIMNAALGLLFLPRAARELMAGARAVRT